MVVGGPPNLGWDIKDAAAAATRPGPLGAVSSACLLQCFCSSIVRTLRAYAHRFGARVLFRIPVRSGGAQGTFDRINRGVPGGGVFESIAG